MSKRTKLKIANFVEETVTALIMFGAFIFTLCLMNNI